ncbi:MAG TPA: Ig-like domain-containing protein, partial [Verrucomicrobiae bacterium]
NKHLIAVEASWSNARNWTTPGGGASTAEDKRSDTFAGTEWPDGMGGVQNTIHLEAGKYYYIEAIHTEGGGGDNVGVTWIKAGDPDPANGSPPIDGSFIWTFQNPDVSTATISITSPADQATAATGSNVPITVNAADPNGGIRKVTYTVDGTVIGETTTAPYSFTWTNAPAGRHTIVATLLDRFGYSIASTPITVAVGTVKPLALLITAATANASDNVVAAHLQDLGYDVLIKGGPSTASGDAVGKNLIVESSSVTSGDVNTKFRGAAVPVIWWEASNLDDYGLEANNVNGTTVGSQTDIFISNATHPLAAGLPAGLVTVYSSPETISTFTAPPALVPDAVVVAETADEATPVIVALEKGAGLNTLAPPATAPERRVFFFLQDNGFSVLTPDGIKLFDAAVAWATGGGVTPPPQPQITVTASGGNINITWTNGGTLEWTSALAPGATWTSTNDSDGSYSEPVNTAQMKFFRVRR